MARRTHDRGPPGGGVPIYTSEKLGPNSERLPNGNLLYRNVPLARIGWMQYGEGETPIEANDRGIAYVERGEDELFAEDTLGSFIGAALTDDHPDEDVTPDNWKELAKGIVLTARRGTGDLKDCVVGDLLIQDKDLITEITKRNKREVSAGYDAKYEQVDVGIGRQSNILVNHVALVDKGRCGPRCAIGDRAYQRKETDMATQRVKLSAQQRVRAIFRDAEARALVALGNRTADEDMDTDDDLADTTQAGGSTGTHIHIHTGSNPTKAPSKDEEDPEENPQEGQQTAKAGEGDDPVEKRFKGIEDSIKTIGDAVAQLATAMKGGKKEDEEDDGTATVIGDEDPEEKDVNKMSKGDAKDEDPDIKEEEEVDKKGKTGDSVALKTAFSDLASKAEILVPGFRMPTFDAKLPRKKTVDAMCGARRRALDMCLGTTDGSALVHAVAGGKKFVTTDGLDCKDVAVLFNAAAGAKAMMNNAAATQRRTGDGQSHQQSKSGAPKSLADLNAQNAQFWAAQNAKAK